MTTAKPKTISREDMIDALVADKFAAFLEIYHRKSWIPLGRPPKRGPIKIGVWYRENQEAAERFPLHLLSLSDAELQVRFQEHQFEIARRSPNDERLFFNEHVADAEYAYWAPQVCWSLEEAAALLLGKDPDVVNLASLDGLVGSSAFASRFARLLYRLQESKEQGELTEHLTPERLLEWAAIHEVDVPPELLWSVEATSEERKAKAIQYEKMDVEYVFEPRASLPSRAGKSGSTREKDTLLKILIAIAVKKYHFRPSAGKSPVPAQIAGDLREVDLSVDPETVLKYLRQGAEHLDQDVIDDLASR